MKKVWERVTPGAPDPFQVIDQQQEFIGTLQSALMKLHESTEEGWKREKIEVATRFKAAVEHMRTEARSETDVEVRNSQNRMADQFQKALDNLEFSRRTYDKQAALQAEKWAFQ